MYGVLGFCSVLTVTTMAVCGMVAAPVLASPADKACSWSTGDPNLDPADADVTASNPMFERNAVYFRTQIRGIAAVDPASSSPTYLICRRYEFSNMSGHEIDEFRWPDIGFGPVLAEPGAEFRIPRHIPHNTTEIASGTTQLFAWENIEAAGVTVFPATTTPHRDAALEAEPGRMYAVEAAQFANALTDVGSEGMLLEAGYSFFAVGPPVELPALRSGFSSQRERIDVLSSATLWPGDGFVSSRVELDYDWDREGEATIHAPGLAALESLEYNSGSDPGDVIATLKALTEEGGTLEVETGGATSFDLSFQLGEESGDPALYVVQQPILLRIGDWSACFLASVYAPVPISLASEMYCGTEN